MTKLQTAFYAITLCLTLSACSSVASPTATSALVVATLTAIPATITPTPGPTDKPSPTPLPLLVWTEPFDKHIELKAFNVEWSPTTNEMVGVEKPGLLNDSNNSNTLVLASAPAFVVTILDNTNKNTSIGSPIWSLSGEKIFYAIHSDHGRFGTGEMWSVARDGADPSSLARTVSGGPIFLGWMDARTLVYESYNGGGEWHVSAFDVSTNLSLFGDSVAASIEKLHPRYIPLIGCGGACTCVLPKMLETDDSPAPKGSLNYSCQSEPGYPTYMRLFPRPKTYPYTLGTIFQDWQAGTNNILILAQGEVSDKPVSRLLFWNVDTDRVTSLAPGGRFGRLSPDGKLLAYITSGPSDQYAEKNDQKIPVDITITDEKQYLQIMNVSTRQIMLRVPVKTHKRDTNSLSDEREFVSPDELSFSLDGRYLTFITDGPITLKDANFPTEAVSGTSTGDYLQIVDLQEEKLIQSLPDKGSVLWAPASDKFICRDDNWHLFELSPNAIRPITLSAGNQFVYPAWSYDGSYLSFSLDYYAAEAARTNKTYILDTGSHP